MIVAVLADRSKNVSDFNKLIDKVVDRGCSCDAMNGYRCGIHEPLMELCKLLAERFGGVEEILERITTVRSETGLPRRSRVICEGLKWQEPVTAAKGYWIRCRKWAKVRRNGHSYCVLHAENDDEAGEYQKER